MSQETLVEGCFALDFVCVRACVCVHTRTWARQNFTYLEACQEESATPEHVCAFFFLLLTFGRKYVFFPCSPSVGLIRFNEGPEWAQWPPTHTSTVGQSKRECG